jgi:hypothetical protein
MVCLQNEPDCNYATRALNIYDGDHSPRISATECRLTASARVGLSGVRIAESQ